MGNFDLEKIVELEIDVFNQYLYMYDWLSRYYKFAEKGVTNFIFDFGVIDANVSEEEFLREKIKEVKEIVDMMLGKSTSAKKISDKEIFKILKDVKIKFPKGECPQVKKDLGKSYTDEDYFEIYNEMLDKKDSKEYKELSDTHGCSIQSLIDILDKLRLFKSKLEFIDLKKANYEYDRLFKEYALMDHAYYGANNPKLKIKIAKARSQKGNYHKLISKKNKIFLDILLEQHKVKGKWKNPAQAVRSNMELITHNFKEFDVEWINENIIVNTGRIDGLKKTIENNEGGIKKRRVHIREMDELELKNEKMKAALLEGYPFYNLEKILPYNTPDFEEILIKSLRKEVYILEEIID
ncbi:MAG: hypothetical protein RR944_14480 [Acinetobacter sp.]|uniref:hypothetical protein n=1 Tax=Acinetobacter sp. TaxID=472 RepID=UPI002FC78787